MASDDFPEEFDIIILGTGLTETIVSAAFSRIGLKILQIDRNTFYGGRYGNFSLEAIEKWKIDSQSCTESGTSLAEMTDSVKALLSDGETGIGLPASVAEAHQISSQHHLRERTAEEEAASEERKKKSRLFTPQQLIPPKVTKEEIDNKQDPTPTGTEQIDNKQDPTPTGTEQIDNKQDPTPTGTEQSAEKEGSVSEISSDSGVNTDNESVSASSSHCAQETAEEDGVELSESSNSVPGTVENTSGVDGTAEGVREEMSGETERVSEDSGTEIEHSSKREEKETVEQELTAGDIKDEWRRFCFDLSPKILHCCGELVELLVQCDVARYCEFRTVSRVLTMLKGQLQEVPCSRADVFSSKIVSLIEKRLMMKFLQFAADYENHPEEYKAFEDKPFREFLQSKKLSGNIQHFVQHAIAMVSDTATTKEGLAKTLKFLQSLGRYGNTAFLFPLYGTGELPQAFSRMSAVFGGTFCLAMTASHLVVDSDNKCTGIISSQGNKIRSKYVIAETSYLPVTFYSVKSDRKLARAIFITEQSVSPSPEPELSLLNHVCGSDPERPVTLLELPPSAAVCPKKFFVVHLSRVCRGDNPEAEFEEIKKELFRSPQEDTVPGSKPGILWSMYFLLDDLSEVDTTSHTPGNVLVTSGGGDPGVDMDSCVQEARQIFLTVCPDEEFLPKPPNPEDIIHVDDTEAPVTEGPSEFESTGDQDGAEEKQGDIEGERKEGRERTGEKEEKQSEKTSEEKTDGEE